MIRSSPLLDWTPQLYDKVARVYASVSRLFVTSKTLAKVLQGLSGEVLDVACGPGALLEAARGDGLAPRGVDISRGMLRLAKMKSIEGLLTQGSYYALPYRDESFDHVVETNALGGVGIDARLALSEMTRVCRLRGEIRLLDYASAVQETWLHRLLVRLGRLIGDEPKPFDQILRQLGYAPLVEVVGGLGMYQLVRAVKLDGNLGAS